MVIGGNMQTIDPLLIGGWGNMDFGKQYHQGKRVYSIDHISMALTHHENSLYLVRKHNGKQHNNGRNVQSSSD